LDYDFAVPLAALTSRQAVLDAIAEHDLLGGTGFREKYGFGAARSYFLLHNGQRYDSKAIVGAAHGFQHPSLGPLRASQFSGGEATVARLLEGLGFSLERDIGTSSLTPSLEVGRTYSWEELSSQFGFKPAYLGAAGGMISRPEHDAVLLITHPGGGKSFDYEDYWDGDDLIYTGRGKTGDQVLDGANGDVAENRRRLLVFEHAGPRSLRFLGQAECRGHWKAKGLGDDGVERLVFRFRLDFGRSARLPPAPAATTAPQRPRQPPHRRSRPFDPDQQFAPFQAGTDYKTREETLALQEKAARGHRDILVTLHRNLLESAWLDIEEVPAAIDLRATSPEGSRVIFEAKTVVDGDEPGQCRCGLAQLLEYRFFFGSPTDELCLVVDGPITDARVRFLESSGVAVVIASGGRLRGVGARASRVLGLG
jgi:hypothetical protein